MRLTAQRRVVVGIIQNATRYGRSRFMGVSGETIYRLLSLHASDLHRLLALEQRHESDEEP